MRGSKCRIVGGIFQGTAGSFNKPAVILCVTYDEFSVD